MPGTLPGPGTRIRRQGGAAAIAAAFGVFLVGLALVFAAVGAYLALLRHVSPEAAALIVAGASLLFGLLSFGVMLVAVRRLRRATAAAVTVGRLAALLPAVLPIAVRYRRVALALLAAGIGAWAATRPRE